MALKLFGPYENERNARNAKLFKDIICEANGVSDVICAHHLVYVANDKRDDGFNYTIVEEIASADTLIFDHDVMAKVFGANFKTVLAKLALEPVETRDATLADLYYNRQR